MSNDPIFENSPQSSADQPAKLHVEDGWVFRERPGSPVECVRRADNGETDSMTQPNQVRHDYPST